MTMDALFSDDEVYDHRYSGLVLLSITHQKDHNATVCITNPLPVFR